MDDLTEVQNLWFAGDAWCKAARLDARSDPEGRPFERRLAAAVQAWRAGRDSAAAHRVLELLVDDLLCEEMPESSWFGEYERGPWVPCTPAEAVTVARALADNRACDAGRQALAWFEALAGRAGAALRYDGDLQAVFLLDPEVGAFYFDVD